MKGVSNTTIPYPKLSYIRFFLFKIQGKTKIHTHDAFEFALVLQGRPEVVIDGVKILPEEGDFFIVNPNQTHYTLCEGSSSLILYLQLSSQYAQEIFTTFKNSKFKSLFKLNKEQQEKLANLYCAASKMYFSLNEKNSFKCLAFVNIFLHEFMQHFPYVISKDMDAVSEQFFSRRMQRVLTYIENHYSDEFPLEDAAKQEGLASAYVAKLFSKNMGKPYKQYLIYLRLEHAVKLLTTTNLPVFEICYECGFNDSRILNKYCHEHFGKTATQCRDMKFVNESEPLLPTYTKGVSHFTDEESLEILSGYFHETTFTIEV